jgi:hypothetical protein
MASTVLSEFCKQRKQLQLFNAPIIRLELQKSPYGQYTKSQLDMRRKAEVLKYAPTQQTNQTNGLTKKQKWTQLIKGNIQQPTQQILVDISNGRVCPNDRLIPTPTSSCDIPGPVMYLIDDETIPLYNYATNIDAFAVDNTTKFAPYAVSNNSNVICSSSTDAVLASILVYTGNTMHTYTFSFTIPLAIYISGSVDAAFSNKTTISIKNITADIYFNDTIINSTDVTINPRIYATQPIVTPYLTNVTLDLSGNIGNFNAVQYIGYITVSNISLNNNATTIYKLAINCQTAVTAYTNISSFTSGVYLNIKPEYANVVNNCKIDRPLTTIPYTSFQYSATSSS